MIREEVVQALVALFSRADEAAASAKDNESLGVDAAIAIATESAMPDITRCLDDADLDDFTDEEAREALRRIRSAT